jgi:hypothetical protein
MRSADEVNSVAYRDVLMNTILGLVMMVAVVFLMVKLEESEAKAQAEPQGNMNIAITWPEGPADVDLWLYGPGEPVPVGYSNKGGRLWNLLRDDLGNSSDATNLNYESASSRGVVPGTYWINLHCYRCPVMPVPVDVEITLNKDAGKKGAKTASKVIFVGKTVLNKQGQERTAISFKMDADGKIDGSSMNSVFKPLRAAKKG